MSSKVLNILKYTKGKEIGGLLDLISLLMISTIMDGGRILFLSLGKSEIRRIVTLITIILKKYKKYHIIVHQNMSTM